MSAADSPEHGGAAAGRDGGRRPWQGRRVLLGVTGGIAAYKSIQVARDLTLLGAEVDVVMTHSARAFVGDISFEALTGRPVLHNILAPGHALDHIRLAREADVVCVVPATADFIARAAHGRSDDLLTAILLATRAPVLICPAMNDVMLAHPATVANLESVRSFGYVIVGPATGPLAWGEGEGMGRVVEPGVVVDHIGWALGRDQRSRGRRVVVTAGPTREAVDPVRVLTNRSSGRMGYAIAEAAWRRGFEVQLISGPVALQPPAGVTFTKVESTEDMARAVGEALADADALIMAAAPADFRPASPAANKIKKTSAPDTLALEPAPDILQTTRDRRREGAVIIGFALETDALLDNARGKLEQKGLDMIVANSATDHGSGFEGDTNKVTLLTRDNAEEIPLQSKDAIAEILIDRLLSMMDRPA